MKQNFNFKMTTNIKRRKYISINHFKYLIINIYIYIFVYLFFGWLPQHNCCGCKYEVFLLKWRITIYDFIK